MVGNEEADEVIALARAYGLASVLPAASEATTPAQGQIQALTIVASGEKARVVLASLEAKVGVPCAGEFAGSVIAAKVEGNTEARYFHCGPDLRPLAAEGLTLAPGVRAEVVEINPESLTFEGPGAYAFQNTPTRNRLPSLPPEWGTALFSARSGPLIVLAEQRPISSSVPAAAPAAKVQTAGRPIRRRVEHPNPSPASQKLASQLKAEGVDVVITRSPLGGEILKVSG